MYSYLTHNLLADSSTMIFRSSTGKTIHYFSFTSLTVVYVITDFSFCEGPPRISFAIPWLIICTYIGFLIGSIFDKKAFACIWSTTRCVVRALLLSILPLNYQKYYITFLLPFFQVSPIISTKHFSFFWKYILKRIGSFRLKGMKCKQTDSKRIYLMHDI